MELVGGVKMFLRLLLSDLGRRVGCLNVVVEGEEEGEPEGEA